MVSNFTFFSAFSRVYLSKQVLLLCCLALLCFPVFGQTIKASWTGVGTQIGNSSNFKDQNDWFNPDNWDPRMVPNAQTEVVIPNTVNKPVISGSLAANMHSLVIMNGGQLTLQNLNLRIGVLNNLTIQGGGRLINSGSDLLVNGNWLNDGTYTEQVYSGHAPRVELGGTNKLIGGSANSFNYLLISGTVGLNNPITIMGQANVVSRLEVVGEFDPGTHRVSFTNVTSDALHVGAGAVLKVKASTYAGNYLMTANNAAVFPSRMFVNSVIEYASPGNQDILPANYGRLTISGGAIKSLTGVTTISPISDLTQLNVISGTLNLGTHTLNRARAGDAVVTGGTLNLANGAFLMVGGTNSFPSGFANINLSINSEVVYNGSNQTVAAHQYGNLTIRSAGTKNLVANTQVNAKLLLDQAATVNAAQNLYVRGDVELRGSATLNGGSHTLTLDGNWIGNATFNPGTSTVRFAGASRSISRSITGPATFHHITVTGTNLKAEAGEINLSGNLLVSANSSLQHRLNGNWRMSGANTSMAGNNVQLHHLEITGSVSSVARVQLAGNLTVNSGGSLVATSGAFILGGQNAQIANQGVLEFQDLLINGTANTNTSFAVVATLNGQGKLVASAGTVTFKGQSAYIGQHELHHVEVAGASLSLGSHASLGIAGTLQVAAQAVFNTQTNRPNTVLFNGAASQTIPALVYHNISFANTGIKIPAGNIQALGSLKIESNATLQAGNFTHTVSGDWLNNGVFVAGAGIVVMAGNGKSIQGKTQFATLRIHTTAMQDQIILASDIQAQTLDMANGTLHTGQNSITVTGDRSGEGWVLGTMRRMHAFAANTTYAFNAPYTTLRLGSVSGVNEVSMQLRIGSVEDFTIGEALNMRYSVAIPAGAYNNAALQFNYVESQLNGNDENALQLYRKETGHWAIAGQDALHTDNNWLSISGLASVTGDWTASSSSIVFQWTGEVSQDWHQAANWELVANDDNNLVNTVVPSSNDIVEFGNRAVNYQPVISQDVEVKTLRFKGNYPVTLSLNDGNLVVDGNLGVSGEGTNTLHTLQVNSNDLTVGGNMQLGNLVGNNSIALHLGSGTVSVYENLLHAAQGSITIGSGSFQLKGNYELSAHFGTFVCGTGSFVYNGDGTQIVGPVLYNDLVINKKSGEAILQTSNVGVVQRHVIMQAGVLNIPTGNYIVMGNVVQHAGRLNIEEASVTVHGDILHYGGEILSNRGSITAKGNQILTRSSIAFNNLTLQPTGTSISLEGSFRVNEELLLQNGIIDIGESQINATLAGRKFTLENEATLALAASNFPENFINIELKPQSTVLYNGTKEQLIAPLTYGNLQLENGGLKKLIASTRVLSDLTIGASATLEYKDVALNLHGNLLAYGHLISIDTAVLVLNSSNGEAKILDGAQSLLTVGNLVVLDGAIYTLDRNLHIRGNATINGNGNVLDTDWAVNGHLDAKGYSVELSGNLFNYGILKGSGTYTLTGDLKQEIGLFTPIQPSTVQPPKIRFNGSVRPEFNTAIKPRFGDVDVNNTDGIYPTVDWEVTGILRVGQGALFNGGTAHHTVLTGIVNEGIIESSGMLDFRPTNLGKGLSQYTLHFGSTPTAFISSGTLRINGSEKVQLTGALPSSLFNVQLQNTHADGVNLTSLSGETFSVSGDLQINEGTTLHTNNKSLLLQGNLANNGQLNGSNSNITFTSAKPGADGNPIVAQFSGIGHSTFNHFEVATNARLAVSTQTIHLNGDFRHNGTAFDGTQTQLKFIGSAPAVMEASDGKSIPIQHLHVSKTGNSTLTLLAPVEQITTLMVESGTLDTQGMPILAAGSASEEAGSLQSFTIDNDATFKLAGNTTLPAFQKYNFKPQSKVSYYGSSQLVQAVQYGHLELLGTGIKTFVGDTAKVAGNFSIDAEQTTAQTPRVFAYNGAGNQQIAPIRYNTLALMGSGSKSLRVGITEVTGDLKKHDATNMLASVNNSTLRYSGAQTQHVLPTDYHNLELTGSGNKIMQGTTGIAAAFTVDPLTTVEILPGSTIAFNGFNDQIVPPLLYENLHIQGDKVKMLAGDITVAKDLKVLAGRLNTENYAIELIGEDSRLVENELAYVTGIIEVTRMVTAGIGQDFGGLGLRVTPTAGASLYTKVQRITGTAVGMNASSILRQYRVYPGGNNTGLNATVEFSYYDHELNGHSKSELMYYVATAPPYNDWKAVTSVERENNTVTISAQPGLYHYTLGSVITPLPVTLLYFKAERNGSDAKLTWATATELDNKGFVVEVSNDGKVYRSLGFVEAKGGTSSLRHNYSFVDSESGKQGVRYYRLRQLDLNGDEEVFASKSIYFGQLSQQSISAYPNPFADNVLVDLALVTGGNATLKVMDMAGRTLYTHKTEVQAGLSKLSLQLEHLKLTTGVYLLTFELNGETQQLKLFKR